MTRYLLVLSKRTHRCQHWPAYNDWDDKSFAMLSEDDPNTCGRPASLSWVAGFGDWNPKWFCKYCYDQCLAIYGKSRIKPSDTPFSQS